MLIQFGAQGLELAAILRGLRGQDDVRSLFQSGKGTGKLLHIAEYMPMPVRVGKQPLDLRMFRLSIQQQRQPPRRGFGNGQLGGLHARTGGVNHDDPP